MPNGTAVPTCAEQRPTFAHEARSVTFSRAPCALAGAADLPEGSVILENDGATRLRLASHVDLAPIDWAALAKHRHPTVQKIAKERAAAKG